MTYTPDIPISGNSLGSTRDRIRVNFQETAAVLAINHIAFNTTGKGKHKYLQMPEVTASAFGVPTTLANEGGVYVEVGTNPAESNLFFRGENNGFEYQLTNANQAQSATFGTFTNYAPPVLTQNGGWTFLPGGLLLQYGTKQFPAVATTTSAVVFPIAFTTLFSVTYSIKSSSSNRLSSETTTGFEVVFNSTQTGIRYYWQAIGLA